MREELTVNIDERMLVPTVENEDALAFSPGRYRLCFEVASGGMATVYLALYSGPLGFERALAVKTIHPHLAKEKAFVEMFLDEARIAAHIDHPFVCKVVDFGEARDSYYIAMEYLVGEPLSVVWEVLQQKPALAASPELPLVFARVVADLAEGLHAAHELTEDGKPVGIVHRDVTPANLFVLYDGTVRIVDFGIAKAQNKLHQTETGMVKGKYAYLSPEQLDHRSLDRRSDVFSLGVVLWEMLTGRRLFRRDSPMETMQAVAGSEIVPPSSYREDIAPELDAIVVRALERDPDKRYSTARALAIDLENFLANAQKAVSRAQVEEWLNELCPGAFRQKRRLVELTRRGESAMPLDGAEEPDDLQESTLEPTTVRHREDDEPVDAEAEDYDDGDGWSGGGAEAGDELDRILYSHDAGRTEEGQELESPGAASTDGAEPAGEPAAATRNQGDTPSLRGPRPRKPAAQPSSGGASLPSPAREARYGPVGGVTEQVRFKDPLLPKVGPYIAVVVLGVALGFGAYQWTQVRSKAEPSGTTPFPEDVAATGSPAAGSPAASDPTAGDLASGDLAAGNQGGPALGSPASGDPTAGDPASGDGPATDDPGEPVAASDPLEPGTDVPYGTLRVSAPRGGAELWEDGRLLGRTEEAISLSPGLHVLELRPYDGSPFQSLEVEIRSGRTVWSSVSLGR